MIFVFALLLLGGSGILLYRYYFAGSYAGEAAVNKRIKAKHIDKRAIMKLVMRDEQALNALDYHFEIDGKGYSKEDLRKWQEQELKKTNALLNRIFNQTVSLTDEMSFEERKAAVLIQKVEIGQEELKKALAKESSFGELSSKIMSTLSMGQRKVSQADIYLKGSRYSAEEVMERFEKMMIGNQEESTILNFKANPNHFFSQGNGKTQEVVEMTGGTRFANNFFLAYGDFSGLKTKTDAYFQVEIAGTGYLADGTVIGGVRHAMVDKDGDLHVRLKVEFPALTPTVLIEQHSIHLLVEFSNWLTDIESEGQV